MTTEHSTYTYKSGEQETVALSRGPLTPHGHARLMIKYSDGQAADCYVDTAWLRDRANDLDPRPLTPDAITDEMVLRALNRKWDAAAPRLSHYSNKGISDMRAALAAALAEPPTAPEWQDLANAIRATSTRENPDTLAAALHAVGVRVVGEGEN